MSHITIFGGVHKNSSYMPSYILMSDIANDAEYLT